ncbi:MULTISPECIES: GIY-YIG nuclease family protein [Vibrio]|uniref:GIY-YIG nuclease family protein n=1 Tax=Vibrio TaxID=662 RepID=UPI00040C55A6|nr:MULTISPECIES: GIY-YIG nuclease family protein [Vibrio]
MILLNDILKLDNLENVRIRFNKMFDGNWDPSSLYKQGNTEELLIGNYHNRGGKKVYRVGDKVFGFIKIKEDRWLLFHAGVVTKDLDAMSGMGYDFEVLPEYDKYCGRLIVEYKNSSQYMIRRASKVIEDCKVLEILSDNFDDDLFPGYENVKLSWASLERVIKKESWQVALENQKGVYLITDTLTGRMYVGSAYGQDMMLGRWRDYVKTLHGNNKQLKLLESDYIKDNFEYSILEIFKSTVDDKVIQRRESWWKDILKTRSFGYNSN